VRRATAHERGLVPAQEEEEEPEKVARAMREIRVYGAGEGGGEGWPDGDDAVYATKRVPAPPAQA